MPFDPENLIRNEKLDYVVEVEHCALCPLGEEALDETGDFTGIWCTLLKDKLITPKCFEEVFDICPLKKCSCNIVVKLIKNRNKY